MRRLSSERRFGPRGEERVGRASESSGRASRLRVGRRFEAGAARGRTGLQARESRRNSTVRVAWKKQATVVCYRVLSHYRRTPKREWITPHDAALD